MPEHAIQLRRAWEAEIDGQTSRLDLPITWGSAPPPPRLRRRFNRPTIDPAREAISLRFESCAGVHGLTLNGRDLAQPIDDDAVSELECGPLLPMGNCLELILEPDAVPRSIPWGRIALVIRSR